jgi:hypothetical protein
VFGSCIALTLALVLGAVEGSAPLGEVALRLARAEPPRPPGPSGPPGPTRPPRAAAPAPPAAKGTTYYLSPHGRDAHPGTSPERPWQTFGRAFNASKPLRPGDVLVLLDGTYTPATTGLPRIDCRAGGTAHSGTASAPIVLRAANERRAHLKSDGRGDALTMTGCQHWQLRGLYGSSADNPAARPWEGNVFHVAASSHLRLTRLLAARPNRRCPHDSLPYCNAHAIGLDGVQGVVLEEAEAYDFHRHGISVFRSRDVVVRRCYVSSRYDPTGSSTSGIILYGTSDSIVENSITEGQGGISIAGSPVFDGTPGGYRNLLAGIVSLRGRYGTTIRARRFDGPVRPAGDNTVRHSVYALATAVGLYARGAAKTRLENVTVFATRGEGGIIADEDVTEGAPCRANPDGCSFTARHVLSFANRGDGFRIDPAVVSAWRIEGSNSVRNGGSNYSPTDDIGDDDGQVRGSRAVEPSGMGLDGGQCLLWVPDGSNMKKAGSGGDVGATILYRYERGELTGIPLWDPATGAFPCGATAPGVNDPPGRSCNDVHRRLNVNTNGCTFPAGYPRRADGPAPRDGLPRREQTTVGNPGGAAAARAMRCRD